MLCIQFCVDWEALALSGSKRVAPNLIQTMINMFLKPGSIAEEEVLYSGQGVIQVRPVVVTRLIYRALCVCRMSASLLYIEAHTLSMLHECDARSFWCW